jgi:ribose transport system permease protein
MSTILKTNPLPNTPFTRKVGPILQSRVFLAFIGLFLLSLVLAVTSTHFFTASNILNVLRQISVVAIVAVGMTYVIISGGIDLSVGSVLALTAVLSAVLMKQGVNMILAIFAGLLLGAFIGFINSQLITSRIGMPPFIATLATMGIARGLTMVVTGGVPIFGLPDSFGFFGGGYLLLIPVPIIIMLVIFAITHIHLTYMVGGVQLFAVGGNPEAARLSGINVNRVKTTAYIVSGITAAIAGVILASRLTSIEPLAGTGYELTAIAATVIGGASLFGGEGSLIGTLLGAMIMGVLSNGLNLLNVSTYWQQVVIGGAIAITVAIGTFRKK